PAFLPGPVCVCPRRWRATGVVRQTLRNWYLQIAFACGVPPQRLAPHYREGVGKEQEDGREQSDKSRTDPPNRLEGGEPG
ncbi:MAG: hypothetical protein AAFP90_06065, partial [Planctomycetota bacterium]